MSTYGWASEKRRRAGIRWKPSCAFLEDRSERKCRNASLRSRPVSRHSLEETIGGIVARLAKHKAERLNKKKPS